MAMRQILTLNAGSSSLKFALFPLDAGMPAIARGQISGIGHAARWSLDMDGVKQARELPSVHSAADALDSVLDWLDQTGHRPYAAGHRIVHGGSGFTAPLLLDASALAALESLSPMAPLHQPHNLAAVRELARRNPDAIQIGCFDTAFHSSMPGVAQRYGLPRALHEQGIRRYGFHGLSYAHSAAVLAQSLPQARRAIVLHLGSGSSACALLDGRSIETTLGFSALDGLLMGTRCGQLDPLIPLHLIRQQGMSAQAVEELLYSGCGLKGVSGLSADMRTLLESPSPAANEAVELYVYRVVQAVGSLTAILGGLDALVFTGGIGEHAAPVRARIAAALSWFGVDLDDKANARHAERLDATGSRVAVLRVRCDEEAVIADSVRSCIGAA